MFVLKECCFFFPVGSRSKDNTTLLVFLCSAFHCARKCTTTLTLQGCGLLCLRSQPPQFIAKPPPKMVGTLIHFIHCIHSLLFFSFIIQILMPYNHETTFAVAALNVMYSSLNSPSKLSGWKSSGGDPCGESWKGIKCSGSSVTEM